MAGVTVEMLKAFGDAWNRHDVDDIMRFMTEDCVFLVGGGDTAEGQRFEGTKAVRARFSAVWEAFPDVRFANDRHFVSGDRGLSQWTFTGTREDGTVLEANGLDLFTFRGDKIWIKDSYLKNRT